MTVKGDGERSMTEAAIHDQVCDCGKGEWCPQYGSLFNATASGNAAEVARIKALTADIAAENAAVDEWEKVQ